MPCPISTVDLEKSDPPIVKSINTLEAEMANFVLPVTEALLDKIMQQTATQSRAEWECSVPNCDLCVDLMIK